MRIDVDRCNQEIENFMSIELASSLRLQLSNQARHRRTRRSAYVPGNHSSRGARSHGRASS
jgi:hypothetical protein